MQLVLKSNSKEITMKIAEILAKYLHFKDVVLLLGDLGAGKTTFTQGLARGLAIQEIVKSPTFNIVKTYYSGKIPLFHIDAYRLEGSKGDIGLDEYMEGNGICVIEWPQYISDTIPSQAINIIITQSGVHKRIIQLTIDDARASAFKSEVAAWLIS